MSVPEIEQRSLSIAFSIISGSIAEPFILADTFGAIVDVNQQCLEMFGYAKSELVGKNLMVLMPREFREPHERAMNRLKETGQSSILGKEVSVSPEGRQLRGLRKDGMEFPVSLLINKLKIGDKFYFTGRIAETKADGVETKIETYRASLSRLKWMFGAAAVVFLILLAVLGIVAFRNYDKNRSQEKHLIEANKKIDAIGEMQSKMAQTGEDLQRVVEAMDRVDYKTLSVEELKEIIRQTKRDIILIKIGLSQDDKEVVD